VNEVRKYSWGAIPYMFHYLKLNDENINKSINDLEWLNWVLNSHIFRHR
jgi:hypothetical protein